MFAYAGFDPHGAQVAEQLVNEVVKRWCGEFGVDAFVDGADAVGRPAEHQLDGIGFKVRFEVGNLHEKPGTVGSIPTERTFGDGIVLHGDLPASRLVG